MVPLISVVMSTYNRANMLKESVESILNQTMKDFEFIIINDNSTDNTPEVLKEYKDSRIKIINNKKNCGCTFNYHNANNLAKGKYIAHIDDDDISFQNRLERQLLFMENNEDIALSGTYIETFGENVRPSWVFYTSPEKLDFMMNFYNPFCHSSVIYRKNFVDRNAINYDITKKCAQDYDFYKQILLNGGKLANIPEILVKYRMHINRLTDIKETQEIQINNAAKIKKELLSRFFDENIISEISSLTAGFPFNDYSKNNVITATDKTAKEYIKINKGFEQILNEIKNDIMSDLYKF